MTEAGIISSVAAHGQHPTALVKEKDGSLSFCVNYRRLDQVTRKDSFPRTDVVLDDIAGTRWFSSLSLHSSYWQVELKPEAHPNTEFFVGQVAPGWCSPEPLCGLPR